MRAALAFTAGLCAAAPAAAIDEVPFVVTPGNVTAAMLDLARVGPADTVYDLGSGDGRIVIGAAQRGARAVGYEIVDPLVKQSREAARMAGVASRTEFRTQDLFEADLSPATVVTMYLLPEVNLQLRPRILQLAPGTRIVSHDWDMGDWTPDRSVTVDAPDKSIGLEKKSRVHLWIVPADFSGRWCAANGALQPVLSVVQSFQALQVTRAAAPMENATASGSQARLGPDVLRREGAALRFELAGQPAVRLLPCPS